MKPALIVLLLFPTICCMAQKTTITGRITDKVSGQPIHGAYLYMQNLSSGSATNANGEFEIEAAATTQQVVVIVPPYKQTKFLAQPGKYHQIALERLALTVQTIQAAHLRNVLDSAIRKLRENTKLPRSQSQVFRRESVTSFNNVIQYIEIVSQDKSQAGSSVVSAIYLEDKRQRDLYWNPSSGGFFTFGWNNLSEVDPMDRECILGARLKEVADIHKYYAFNYKGILEEQARTTHVIDFDQRNIKGSFLKGTIYLDVGSNSITRIEYSLSPKGKKYLQPNRTIGGRRICNPPYALEFLTMQGFINYLEAEGQQLAANSSMEVHFNVAMDTTKRKHFLKMFSEAAMISMPQGPRRMSAPSSITHDQIKRSFDHLTCADFSARTGIKAVFDVDKLCEKIQRINLLWEKNTQRKAREELIASTRLTQRQLTQDLDYLKSSLEQLHPAVFDNNNDHQFKQAYQNIKTKIPRIETEEEFHKAILPMITALNCTRTTIIPCEARQIYQAKYGKYFPLDVVIQNNRVFVKPSAGDSALFEILKINGVKMATILNGIFDKVSSGSTQPEHKDYVLAKNFQELLGLHFFQPDTFRLELRNHRTELVEGRKIASRGSIAPYDSTDPIFEEFDSVQTARMAFPSFTSIKKLQEFLEVSFDVIRNKRITNLVLDLRDNDSVRDWAGPLIYSFLTAEEFAYIDRIIVQTADTSKLNKLRVNGKVLTSAIPALLANLHKTDSGVYYIDGSLTRSRQPAEKRFHGNLYVLVNEGTLNSAADLAHIITHKGRGQLLGTEISSHTRSGFSDDDAYLVLPNSGLRINMPLLSYYRDDHPGTREIVPVYPVRRSIDSLLSGEDEVLEEALRIIAQNCCAAKSN